MGVLAFAALTLQAIFWLPIVALREYPAYKNIDLYKKELSSKVMIDMKESKVGFLVFLYLFSVHRFLVYVLRMTNIVEFVNEIYPKVDKTLSYTLLFIHAFWEIETE